MSTTQVTVAVAKATLVKINGDMSSTFYTQDTYTVLAGQKLEERLREIAGGSETHSLDDFNNVAADSVVGLMNLL